MKKIILLSLALPGLFNGKKEHEVTSTSQKRRKVIAVSLLWSKEKG